GDEAVVLEGVVEEIQQPSASLVRQFFEAYKAKYQWDMDSMDEDAGPIFRVHPKVVFGLSTGLAESATRWRFDQ
ncbi:MAG TPA: hypothetical protein VJX67_01145, partial [Blastocatellia bacterium]|nr:hypothetical protein [Blastocatellia bacterium]